MTETNPWWQSAEFATASWLLAGTALASLLLWTLHRHSRRNPLSSREATGWKGFLNAAAPPLQFAAWYYFAYFALPHILHFVHPEWEEAVSAALTVYFWHLGLLIAFFGFLYRMVTVVELRMGASAAIARTPGPVRFDNRLYPLIALALRTLIPLFGLLMLLQLLPLPARVAQVLDQLLGVGFILGFSWIIQNGIVIVEQAILGSLDPNKTENFAARGIQTRVGILRKFAVVVNVLFAAALILLQFKEVQAFGKSMLASAGIAGIILGIAAQQTLGTLFAGLQIALSQPIRIGDWVIVEGESGAVEEITLTYVVIRIWDLRRLVLPITYFIQKPFQNWTRASTTLITTVKLRVDFSLPLAAAREEMKRWIETVPQWDKQTYAFQVTDADSNTMELRIIASAPNSGACFDLQCAIREKLITYLAQNHPDCLPRSRQESVEIAAEKSPS